MNKTITRSNTGRTQNSRRKIPSKFLSICNHTLFDPFWSFGIAFYLTMTFSATTATDKIPYVFPLFH